ncbi:MAG: GNAT family N-acetyltransferase, partial [Pseudomonadota bacterium]
MNRPVVDNVPDRLARHVRDTVQTTLPYYLSTPPGAAMISLRKFQSTDADRVHQLLNDKEVSRYLTSRVKFPYSLEDATWWVEEGSHHHPTWAIEADQQVIGCIGIVPGEFEQSHTAEIGYWIGKLHWGKGYASLALQKATTYTFNDWAITRLTAGVFHPNIASMQVLKHCGYTLEGVFEMAYY